VIQGFYRPREKVILGLLRVTFWAFRPLEGVFFSHQVSWECLFELSGLLIVSFLAICLIENSPLKGLFKLSRNPGISTRSIQSFDLLLLVCDFRIPRGWPLLFAGLPQKFTQHQFLVILPSQISDLPCVMPQFWEMPLLYCISWNCPRVVSKQY